MFVLKTCMQGSIEERKEHIPVRHTTRAAEAADVTWVQTYMEGIMITTPIVRFSIPADGEMVKSS